MPFNSSTAKQAATKRWEIQRVIEKAHHVACFKARYFREFGKTPPQRGSNSVDVYICQYEEKTEEVVLDEADSNHGEKNSRPLTDAEFTSDSELEPEESEEPKEPEKTEKPNQQITNTNPSNTNEQNIEGAINKTNKIKEK